MFIKIPLSWLQLTHNKTRFLVAVTGITFSVFLVFMQLGFQSALYDTSVEIYKHLHADLVLLHPRSEPLFDIAYRRSFSMRRLDQALGFKGVESVSALYVGFADWKNPNSPRNRGILVLGFDPQKSVFDLPELNQNLNKIKLPDVVLFDRASRPEFGPIVTEFEKKKVVTTAVNNRKVKVVGLFTIGGSVFSADGILITSDLNFVRLLHRPLTNVSVGLIKLTPGADPQQIINNLAANLPKDIKVLTINDFMELEKKFWADSSPIGYVFTLGAVMGFIVGAVIVSQILYTDVSIHLGEYATLKALGYKNIYFLGVVLQEALFLSVLGYIPGFALSSILYNFVTNAIRLPMNMDFGRVLLVLALTFLMCFIASATALNRLRAANPADIF